MTENNNSINSNSNSNNNQMTNLYVVSVDCRGGGHYSDIGSYAEEKCRPDYFQDKIVNNPKIKVCTSAVGKLCGFDNIKIYFAKARKGLGQHYREGGQTQCTMALMQNQNFLSRNNGAASFLSLDVDSGLAEWTIESKAYVVCDDGATPLSKEQVWAVVDIVSQSMDIYDFDPPNMVRGKNYIEQMGRRYQSKTHSSQTDGQIDIYRQRSP